MSLSKKASLYLHVLLFLKSQSAPKFSRVVIRERAHGKKTGRFIFTHERPALRVIFSLSGKNATFARAKRHDFSFPTSTVKLTSKSLRTTWKVHHFPPLVELETLVDIQGVQSVACLKMFFKFLDLPVNLLFYLSRCIYAFYIFKRGIIVYYYK